ncbi:CHAT domain-containing protein [Streptomyces sp. NBC_00539]|uniref:CHAT domain-containing protein n=1 Tax=Streptomyces sp. NBC_00539 TaxID=2975770 RepID=UPI002E819733|nr:CHAT domain-containing protein [Streptomyces sp. NBC_00539]WUC62923.1 CHAT domain-containing protein [Streptomyces sp. NBC_00539]
MRDEQLAALRARLRRINGRRDLAVVLDPEAVRQARRLEPYGERGDLEVLRLLGWFHLYRAQALPDSVHGIFAMKSALDAFGACFRAAVSGLPEVLLPLLADEADRTATAMLEHALAHPDSGRLATTVDLWQRILGATPAEHPERASRLARLGTAKAVLFDLTGSLEDLNDAVTVLQEAVATAQPHDPQYAGILSHLGLGLFLRSERTGDPDDLNSAIGHFRKALRAFPADFSDRSGTLSNLAGALVRRYERTSAPKDLNEAIALGHEAVAASQPRHADRAGRLSNLGTALMIRFARTGALEDLNTAIDHFHEAYSIPVDAPFDHAGMVLNLGCALLQRFHRKGGPEDLNTAIDHIKEAVETVPPGYRHRAGWLSILGGALGDRFELTGALEDLDDAIAFGRQAVAATPADHPDRASWSSNLAAALRHRFDRTGAEADLEAAIDAGQQAVDGLPLHNAARGRALANLGGALLRRYERNGSLRDLDLVIDHFSRAVDETLHDHDDYARWLSNLGTALRSRSERTGAEADLEAAVAVGRKAVATAPLDHPERGRTLSNLALALFSRFRRTKDRADLDAAILGFRQAVSAVPDSRPERASFLCNLAVALGERFIRGSAAADLDEAVRCQLEAAAAESAAPSVRVRAAWTAAALLFESGDVTRAAEAAEEAVLLLPQVTPRRLERSDQQYAIGAFAGLATTAAALALTAPGGTASGRAGRALRLLEAGRAVLIGQALDTRSDLTDLRQHHPELARRFTLLRERLDAPTDSMTFVEGGGGPAVQHDPEARHRRRLVDEFASLLAEIRSLKGFSSFASPPTIEELLSEASHGPVVIFNVSAFRSDALLLTSAGITSVELPLLTEDKLFDQITGLQRTRQAASAGSDQTEREQAQAHLVDMLQWLWDVAAGPVLEALGYADSPSTSRRREGQDEEWPRVWWIPGGLLGQLPLHAAGYHTDPAEGAPMRTVMDRVVSSYTPSVRTLRYARERAHARAAQSAQATRSLIVAMPTTPGLPDEGRLDFVAKEVTKVWPHLPHPLLLKEPGTTEGTAEPTPLIPTSVNVLTCLPDCTFAHFACHGDSDSVDPSKSLLLLHDHREAPLTVATLAATVLDRAGLAYLSACRTAAVDHLQLLDEAIHLTSAFQLAGFPHVIGTLWEIDDQVAVTIADDFYTGLRVGSGRMDPERAARALHEAVRRVRDGHDLPPPFDRRGAPLLWAAYLHAGA